MLCKLWHSGPHYKAIDNSKRDGERLLHCLSKVVPESQQLCKSLNLVVILCSTTDGRNLDVTETRRNRPWRTRKSLRYIALYNTDVLILSALIEFADVESLNSIQLSRSSGKAWRSEIHARRKVTSDVIRIGYQCPSESAFLGL